MARMLLKPPSCGVFFGNLHSKVTDKHLLELGTQVSHKAHCMPTQHFPDRFVFVCRQGLCTGPASPRTRHSGLWSMQTW